MQTEEIKDERSGKAGANNLASQSDETAGCSPVSQGGGYSDFANGVITWGNLKQAVEGAGTLDSTPIKFLYIHHTSERKVIHAFVGCDGLIVENSRR